MVFEKVGQPESGPGAALRLLQLLRDLRHASHDPGDGGGDRKSAERPGGIAGGLKGCAVLRWTHKTSTALLDASDRSCRIALESNVQEIHGEDTSRKGTGMLKFTSFILMFSLAGSAQSSQNTPTKEPEVMYSQVPFHIGATQLSPSFAGHDIVRLWNALHDFSKIRKDEYETTGAFNQRLAALQLKPLIGTITETSVLAFLVPKTDKAASYPSMSPGYYSEYDADKGFLRVDVRLSYYSPKAITQGAPHLQDYFGAAVTVSSHSKISSYVGSNAYGATTKVIHEDEQRYEALWDNAKEYFKKDAVYSWTGTYDIGYDIQAEPETARRIRETLSALVVLQVKDDTPTFEESQDTSATFSSPYSSHTARHFLNTKLLAVWLFDSSSGKIFAKIEPTR